MRFHVLSLPHTQTTKAYSHCAYTEKIRKFCDMMMTLGHEVFLYAGEENEASCTELIPCTTKEIQKSYGFDGPLSNLNASFDPNAPHWQRFNEEVVEHLYSRLEERDFICITAGLCQKEVADTFPKHMNVEIGIGYGGVFSPNKVFESYAWMHTVYGAMACDPHQANGNAFDAVIPNFFEPKDFPFSAEKDDYFLFMGRLIERKGYQVAVEVCKRLDKRLVVAGQGEPPEYGEYVGVVGPEKRGELLSRAQAVFVPTQYVEPFGGVHAEAMLCGTPVITTDWGAFVETVENGVHGFRCRTLQDFMDAAEMVDGLDYLQIHGDAVDRFAMDRVKGQYESYFERLLTLWGEGWYTTA
jgi:glycosyltransferase involved in cell wall biosynthesis